MVIGLAARFRYGEIRQEIPGSCLENILEQAGQRDSNAGRVVVSIARSEIIDMPPAKSGTGSDRLEQRRGPLLLVGIYGGIAAITALHYLTGVHAHQLHDIYRRLYYLPIILAAFLHGTRGGVIAALVVCVAYLPHATGHISHDPASDTTKALEMVLYLAVGLITGSLVSRLTRTQRRLETTADDLRRSLEQLRATEERLIQEARLAAVGRLSAGLAHEIRNPLASIKGSAEILADDFPEPHPKRRILQVLVDEAVRLNDVLSRFLSFARPRPPDRRAFDLGTEADEVVSLMQSRPEAAERRIRWVHPDGPPLRLLADAGQIRQVLINILLNALQATPAGGEVELRCERRGNEAVCTIQDGGPGFSAEALANAFTPFFTTKDGGTGLGLALSHRIVEQHGGSIRLSRTSAGGRVEIALPAVD
jgi:signal transduction histidine kinase